MNRERAKELLPIIQAFAEGKVIQFRRVGEVWRNLTDTDFDSPEGQYRIKPEKKKIEFWVNVYPNHNEYPHWAREHADKTAGPTRTACLHVVREYEDGEGI